MRVGIIGAGIAGLSAGYRLYREGICPVIFDKDPSPGGRMGSDHTKGFIFDKGAYTIPETHHYFLEMIRELGLAGQLVETPGTSSTMAGRDEHKMKVGSPTDFLKYKLLSFGDKKDLVKLFLYAKSLGRKLDLHDPTPETLDIEKDTVSGYLIKNYSRELLEKIAAPIFADLFLGVPEDNSAAVFLSAVRNLTRFKIFTLDKGMGAVAEKLSSTLDIRQNSKVINVKKENGMFRVDLQNDSSVHKFDKIIFAVPLPLVPGLFDGVPTLLKQKLENVRYTPSVVVGLGLEETFDSHSFMINFLRHEISTLATLVLDGFKGKSRVPEGRGMVTAILTKDASMELIGKTDDQILKAVTWELDSLWPRFSRNIICTQINRWPFGAVQIPPGTLSQQVQMRKELENLDPDMAFAGDGLFRASLEVSTRTGYNASERIMKYN